MKCLQLLLAGAIAALASLTSTASASSAADTKRCFPDDFLFGSATAAYQVEGAWNEGGRTPSIWDDMCHQNPAIQCANVADDFYHRYKDDIQLMVASGLDSFRFSISWSRAMNWDPATKKMKPNPQGIAFYHALIDELNRNRIAPILTLFHWDLPVELQFQFEPQGWLNPEIIDNFVQYAELMYTEYGAKVDMWSTFNEPLSFIPGGYGTGRFAAGITTQSKTNAYTAAHNMLLSHGKAVQRFRELKQSSVVQDKARIGIVLNHDYGYPLNGSDPTDVAAAERRIQFELGWFLTPIVSGKYPDIMRERAGDSIPEFTEEEVAIMKDSYDLLMLNHYSSHNVVDCASPHSTVNCSTQTLGWESDLGVDDSHKIPGARLASTDENGKPNSAVFSAYPQGYFDLIKWVHAQQPAAQILLTENGWCGNETIDNQDQLWYFQSYMGEVHKAITELKIPIIGYTAWSFMDNYEWGSFKPRFGLYYVNFTSETGKADEVTPGPEALARIPRTAAKWFAQVAKTKCLDGIEIDEVPVVAETGEIDAADSTSSGFKTIVLWGLVVAFAVAVPATVLYLTRHHRARQSTADEATPLVRGQ